MARAKAHPAKAAPGFVLDNSIVMAWSFADEVSAYADAVLDRLTAIRTIVPVLWPLEVANALLMGERRKRAAGDHKCDRGACHDRPPWPAGHFLWSSCLAKKASMFLSARSYSALP